MFQFSPPSHHPKSEILQNHDKKNNKLQINADLFMRLADIAETAPEVGERDALVTLSEDVMRAVDMVDKAKAVKVSKAIK